jgi:integrase
LTFARPGEIRAAEWSEFDLDRALWSIPARKMKMRRPYRIPLAARAVIVLRELHRITGHGRFLFPSNRSRDRCMSENTIKCRPAQARLLEGRNDRARLSFGRLIDTK